MKLPRLLGNERTLPPVPAKVFIGSGNKAEVMCSRHALLQGRHVQQARLAELYEGDIQLEAPRTEGHTRVTGRESDITCRTFRYRAFPFRASCSSTNSVASTYGVARRKLVRSSADPEDRGSQ